MTTPYRFVITLDQQTRRKLAELQAASVDKNGRMQTAAGIVRRLVMEAPLEGLETAQKARNGVSPDVDGCDVATGRNGARKGLEMNRGKQ